MRFEAILTATIFGLCAAPVAANDDTPLPATGWDYAQWGMEADAVIAASNGNAVSTDATDTSLTVWDYPQAAEGTTKINGYDYTLKMHFDPNDGGLTFAKIGNETKPGCLALKGYYEKQVKSVARTFDGVETMSTRDDDDYWSAPIGGNRYAFLHLTLPEMDFCFMVVADASATINRD